MKPRFESEQGQDATEEEHVPEVEVSVAEDALVVNTAEEDCDGEDSGESFHAGWRAMQKTADIRMAKRPQETSFNTEDHFWRNGCSIRDNEPRITETTLENGVLFAGGKLVTGVKTACTKRRKTLTRRTTVQSRIRSRKPPRPLDRNQHIST